jgi:hypothetical protein
MQPTKINGEPPERRRRPRLRLSYALSLHRPGEASSVETKTEDISCEGFFCISEIPFAPHEIVECYLVIPRDTLRIPVGRDLILHCTAEVVRVARNRAESSFGIACRLEDYTLSLATEPGHVLPAATPPRAS